MKVEFLNVGFEIKSLDSEADKDFVFFEGYASTFGNIDRGFDVIEKGAFTETLKSDGMPVLLWQHDHDMPIGVFVEAREDEKGLFVRGKLPKDDTFVSGRVVPQMRVGSVKDMSIGYSVQNHDEDVEWKEKVVDGKPRSVRYLRKVRLWETSLVTIPMNPKASITGMTKAVPSFRASYGVADASHSWDGDAAVGRVREKLGATEAPNAAYAAAFMWYDADNADDFGAYKLPFVDVIGGKLMIVPKALSAIKGALSGARGGLNIPADDKTKVRALLQRYLDKAGMSDDGDEDGKSLTATDLVGVTTKRQLERLLRDTGMISKSAATMIANLSSLDEKGVIVDGQPQGDDDEIVDGQKNPDGEAKSADLRALLDSIRSIKL